MPHKIKLNRAAENYCYKLVSDNVLQRRKRYNPKNKKVEEIWYYPAIAVACCCKKGSLIITDHSRGVREKHLEPPLVLELQKLGNIGEPSKIGEKYIIGHCAEPHAANGLIKKTKCSIADIYFSLAIRPRTHEIKNYCANCIATFPNLT